VYCHKRSDCDELAAMLDAEATPTVPYHSGLKDEQRYR
jgi:superfamily II DNA helicase RecQ